MLECNCEVLATQYASQINFSNGEKKNPRKYSESLGIITQLKFSTYAVMILSIVVGTFMSKLFGWKIFC